jgi:ElaA protein
LATTKDRLRRVVHVADFAELDAATLYALLKLRAEVFVVEQECAYLDPDGRDAEPGCRHLWIDDSGSIVAALRLLDEGDGTHRVGRVVTAPHARGRGLAAELTRHAIAMSDGPIVLDAQTHLVDWYRGFGFDVSGAEFVEDGIPHVPMRRP